MTTIHFVPIWAQDFSCSISYYWDFLPLLIISYEALWFLNIYYDFLLFVMISYDFLLCFVISWDFLTCLHSYYELWICLNTCYICSAFLHILMIPGYFLLSETAFINPQFPPWTLVTRSHFVLIWTQSFNLWRTGQASLVL